MTIPQVNSTHAAAQPGVLDAGSSKEPATSEKSTQKAFERYLKMDAGDFGKEIERTRSEFNAHLGETKKALINLAQSLDGLKQILRKAYSEPSIFEQRLLQKQARERGDLVDRVEPLSTKKS